MTVVAMEGTVVPFTYQAVAREYDDSALRYHI